MLTVSTLVSKTKSLGSNPSLPAKFIEIMMNDIIDTKAYATEIIKDRDSFAFLRGRIYATKDSFIIV